MINPKPSLTSYDVEGGWVSSPDLAILTVAAMAPGHWTVDVAEEAVSPVNLDHPARFIGLTGKSSQYRRIVELSEAFRRRGKTVLIGGPFASLDPEAVRLHADILFTGEMEDIAPEFFADLEAGVWKAHYEGGRADIRKSPVPRWDLYPTSRSISGALQTTRGCPFDCEFCDVIQYQGRKQRHKDLHQILAELDALYAAGFRETFLCDDNLTVHRTFARQTLDAIAEWNAEQSNGPMRFRTQASLDIARDDDLLRRCVRAGLTHLFIGIETVNEASLRATNKRQNLLLPILDAVNNILSHGIYVRAGVIVGFDQDGPSIFDDLFQFFQNSPLPDLSVGVLTASFGTPLYARLKREGRLLEGRWEEYLSDGNIIPKLMTREQLANGTRELAHALFSAEAYERRLLNLIAVYGGEAEASPRRTAPNERIRSVMGSLKSIPKRSERDAKMLSRVLDAATEKPAAMAPVMSSLTFYAQTRAYLDRVQARAVQVA